MFIRRRIVVGVLAVLVAAVIVVTIGFVVTLSGLNDIHRSSIAMPEASPGVPQETGEVNILVMGLDSRVDQNGDPYPQDIYDAIHAEDETVGGYNTNVLIYIHIPANGGKAVGISIPRDDYVDYANSPGGVSAGKIKEDYGRTFEASYEELTAKGTDQKTAYQQARNDAREAQIKTVSQFLGGVRIDHFVEVTMAAFYRVAQAVQPITVCLNHATADTYSGANFAAGVQQLDASQAMAFVRQRRDTQYDDVFLTDLDRTRRQQAFMVSLALKLKDSQTFTNFGTLQSLVDTAKQYVALDQGFDLLSLASTAQRLAGGAITFQTLPVERFGTVDGESVNIVDQAKIAQIVQDLLHPPAPTAAPTDAASASPSPTAADTAAPPQAPTAAPTQESYTDSQQPMVSGALPCVN